jgi:hypothetical protein
MTTPSYTCQSNWLLGRFAGFRRSASWTIIPRCRRIRASSSGKSSGHSGQEKQFAFHRRSLLDQGSWSKHQFLVPILGSPKGRKMYILLHSLQRLCHFPSLNASSWSPRTSRRPSVFRSGTRSARYIGSRKQSIGPIWSTSSDAAPSTSWSLTRPLMAGLT